LKERTTTSSRLNLAVVKPRHTECVFARATVCGVLRVRSTGEPKAIHAGVATIVSVDVIVVKVRIGGIRTMMGRFWKRGNYE
jgi:hypothetical protein